MSDPVATTRAPSSYPNLNPNGTAANSGSSFQGVKDSVVNNASSAYDTVANHPVTQSITQGPVAEKARDHLDKTSNEFANVANSRRVPDQPAATGQPLTHYHSFFYNILSWENPRVSAIAYAAITSFIFFTRYVPFLKLFLKGTYIILGIIAAAEMAGKLIFDRGLASQMRPRKYYTIPRENLERALEDAEQFINFFVIEFQRIIFAENIYATVAAFTSALVFYVLQKFTPTWGIALTATTVVFFLPLIYKQYQEVIDGHLNNAQNVINEQSSQLRDLAAQHTGKAADFTKSTMSQYTAKAQDLIGQGKNKAASPSTPNPVKDKTEREIKKEDFPSAPGTVPTTGTTETVIPSHSEQPLPTL